MKYRFLTLGLSFMGSLAWGAITACAQQNDALFVWADGSETCYQLDQMPKVVYDGGKAFVYVREQTKGGYNEADAWIICPEINLTDAETPALTFEHSAQYCSDSHSDYMKLYVVENNENGMMVDVNKDGLYWTSTLDTYNNNSAYGLITRFSEGNAGVLTGIDNRQYARVIRAVRK